MGGVGVSGSRQESGAHESVLEINGEPAKFRKKVGVRLIAAVAQS
jgi:hypothetical protein